MSPAAGRVQLGLLLLLLGVLPGSGGDACDAALAKRVQASLGSISDSTGCPENQWLQDFLLSDSRRGVNRTAVVFDIGCNKGFDALNALNLFRQEVVVSGRRWKDASQFGCGVCGQCTGPDHVAITGAQGRPTEVFCAEPLPANFHRLNATAAHFHLERNGFHIIHAAFTSEEDAHARHWAAKFPVWSAKERKDKHFRKLIGYEAAGIGVNPSCPHCSTVNVPLMVLDRLVEQRQLPVIDYLIIDTEGNDPNVLLGASRSLPLVRYLEFEYHNVGVWAHTSLRDVVERLKGHGFACYWIGKGKVWRLTDCWHDAYHKHGWSNVGCVQTREAEWYAILEGYFNRTVPH
eukprot:EG_transcript_16840